jgi:hypothetical protein
MIASDMILVADWALGIGKNEIREGQEAFGLRCMYPTFSKPSFDTISLQ